MNSNNKQLTYKIWLDELNTTPSKVFLLTFKQFLDLLINENLGKIKILDDRIDEETRRLAKSGGKAVKALEKLLRQVEIEAKKEKIESLPEIDAYKQVKRGKIRVLGEDLPDSLYHAIRLTIEEHRNQGKLKSFDRLMSVNGDVWYLDYEKISKAYPAYKQFEDAKEDFTRGQKEEPWGALIQLKLVPKLFENVPLEKAGSFAKTDIINNLRRFILYLLTPEVEDAKTKPGRKVPYSFDKKRGLLKVRGKEFLFKGGKRRVDFLSSITKNVGYVYFGELADELEGADKIGKEKAKDIYYEVCRGIEARLLKAGISDFLDYNFNRVRINPRYKKVKN